MTPAAWFQCNRRPGTQDSTALKSPLPKQTPHHPHETYTLAQRVSYRSEACSSIEPRPPTAGKDDGKYRRDQSSVAGGVERSRERELACVQCISQIGARAQYGAMTPFLPEARGDTRPEGPRSLGPESTLKVSISPRLVLLAVAARLVALSTLVAAGTLLLLVRLIINRALLRQCCACFRVCGGTNRARDP